MGFHKSKKLLTTIILTAFFVSAGCLPADVTEKINRSFNVGEGGTLTLSSDIGSIEIKCTTRDKVDVEVQFQSGRLSMEKLKETIKDFTIDFSQNGKDVIITAKYKKDSSKIWKYFGKNLRVKFLIDVPQKYNVDLKTAGGSISVEDLEGKVKSRTSGGSLDFGRIKGPVYGVTSGGSINLEACSVSAEVKTSGGSISIGHVTGNVLAKTSGGSIHVEEVLGTINASTSGGSVKVNISKQPKDDCKLTTSGGTVTAYLVKGVKLNINAKTSGGRVRTEFPVTVKGDLSKRSLVAELNGGGPELYLRTSGGSIYIKEL